MRIIYGEIEPGIRIGKYLLGSTKEEILPRLEDYKVWERGDGFCIYSFDNFKLWFGVNNELEQIGVTKGFFGTYNSVRIGTTMLDIKKIFGRYENDGDVYIIPGIAGICFELEDVDGWDELTAPIEWILYINAKSSIASSIEKNLYIWRG